MKKFLESSTYIDWQTPAVMSRAIQIGRLSTRSLEQDAAGTRCTVTTGGKITPEVSTLPPLAVVRNCFVYVRDEIRHSTDYGLKTVTIHASEVLKYGAGLCYGKSHLLAAMLRANGVLASLCYQRLALGDGRFCLHSLNAVWLESMGWCRLDARGDNSHIHTEFSPPDERLAFKASKLGEQESLKLHSEPHAAVIERLTGSSCIDELKLPDSADF